MAKGSVRKKGATWSYRIDLGILDGKRKQMERSGFALKKDAEAALSKALADLNEGNIVKEKRITLQELFDEFITLEAPLNRKTSTIVRYNSLYRNHLHRQFGYCFIGDITSKQLQEMIVQKREILSDEYVRSIYAFLTVLFKYAITKSYLKKDPTSAVTVPKSPRSLSDIKIYTDTELEMIKDRITSTNLLPAFNIALNLGLRAGECYALRWRDFDFEKNTVKIDKQLQNIKKHWTFTTPKTSNSYRTIRFGQKFSNYMQTLKQQQEEFQQLQGPYWKKNLIVDSSNPKEKKPPTIIVEDFVNIKPDGEMLNTNSHKVIARIAAKELNIDFKFHNLRHTHATKLLENGLNPRYVQERLGHSKLEFTLRLYTHVTQSMDESAAKIMDDLFPPL